MSKEWTLSNIRKFMEGYSRVFYDKIIGLPKHQQEQIEYRASLCRKDCAVKKECIKCGCNYPEKLFNYESCNVERFPAIMDEQKWVLFKKENNII